MQSKFVGKISLKKKIDQIYNLDRLIEAELSNSLNEILVSHSLLLQHYDAEGLHQLRVTLRRLFSFLRFFRKELPKHEWKKISGVVKKLIKPTSKVRDFDVFNSNYIEPAYQDNNTSFEFRNLLNQSHEELLSLHRQLSDDLSSAEYHHLLQQLKSWVRNQRWKKGSTDKNLIEQGPFREKIQKKLNQRLNNLFGKIKKVKKNDRKALHKLRIEVKELRYVLDVLHVAVKHKKRQLKYLKELQELLGKINDSYIAEQIVNDINISNNFERSKVYLQGQTKYQRECELQDLQRNF